MRKKSVLVACVLVLAAAALSVAQEPPDLGDLEMRAASSSGEEKLGLLIELSRAYGQRDATKQAEYAREALQLARDLNDPEAEGHSLFSLGCGQRDQGEFDNALESFSRAQNLFESQGFSKGAFNCIKNKGWVYEYAGQLDLALECHEEALELAREIGFENGEAEALQFMGIVHFMGARLDAAMEHLIAALEIQERLGNRNHVANIRTTIGSVYIELEQYDRALEVLEQSLQVFEESGNLQNTAIAVNNIGIVYRMTDRPDQAKLWFERSLEIAEEIGDLYGVGRALHNLSNSHADMGEIDTSLRYDERALDVWREIGNTIGIAESLDNLGAGNISSGRPERALEYLHEALAVAQEIEETALQYSIYRNLAEAHEALGDHRQALTDLRASVALNEQIMNAEVQETIAELDAKYEAEKNGRRIDLLEKNLRIQELELSRVRFRSAAIISVCIILVIVVVLFFRKYLHLLTFWKKSNYISHYKLQKLIGSGGMGVVYEASDLMEKGRSVAIKVIRKELAEDPAQRKRFLNEAYLVDKLNHPNIIRVFERGEHDQTLWIAMELLDGRTLAEVIGDGTRLPIGDCLAIMEQLADALTQIHSQDILHRDVKPENVMVLDDGGSRLTVKLLDFGLAKAPSLTRLTETGEILGTVTYLPPEQITDREALPAGDVYALGVVFYELLTLEKPFWGDNPGEIVRAILDASPLEPMQLRTELPAELNSLVMRMISEDAGMRPTGEDVASDLDRCRAAS